LVGVVVAAGNASSSSDVCDELMQDQGECPDMALAVDLRVAGDG
jgi:hypothetical protein